jgi:hypothetical protein
VPLFERHLTGVCCREKWAQALARNQLRKAGFRLAALLAAIFPDK